MTEVLTARALGRATLARQYLLDRVARGPAEAIEHLVGLQAQAPNAPYVALWSRLADFDPGTLAALIAGRGAVRMPLQRATLHLVSTVDCVTLRPVLRPVLERAYAGSPFARLNAGVDHDALLAWGRTVLDEAPRTRAELGPRLVERWPGYDGTALAYAVTTLLPVVQVPPRGVWGRTGPAAWATVERWLDRPLSPDSSPATLVLRYLAAFGPASVRDVQTWSGLTRLREVLDELRPGLRVFHDDRGTELYDLPDAPRPDPDTPAPPRFLGEYDNVLLGHADRTRVIPGTRRPPLFSGNGATMGTFLVDGLLRGTWQLRRDGVLVVEPYTRLAQKTVRAVQREAVALLGFLAPGATPEIRFAPPG